MTPCSLQECIDADMPRFFELFSLGFGPEKYPYVEHVFPKHDTSEGRKIGGERMLTLKHLDAQATWLKITENPSEKMIACAKWNIYSNTIPPEFGLEGEYWDSQDEKEYAQHLFAEYLVPRRKAIRDSGGNLVILDLLIVDPEYQRQGAGRMLVKWGTDVADRMGVEAVVEATDCGVGLYKSEGFELEHRYEIPLPENWRGKQRQTVWWLRRPLRRKGEAVKE